MVKRIELGLHTFGDVTRRPDGQPNQHAQVLRDIVDEGILADQAGVDFFGVGEHHRADFAVSAPEVVLSAIAARTGRIRLGTAATILGTDDPIRLFQRFSSLAAVCDGRVEVMVGRGWFTEGFSLFGYDISQYDSLFIEKLGQFTTILRSGSVTRPDASRTGPVKHPIFPPLEAPLKAWLAVGATPESALRAANYDLALMLSVIGGPARRFLPLVQLYRQGCEKLGRPCRDIGVHSPGYVAATDEQAREEFWPDYQRLRARVGVERKWPPISEATFNAEIDQGALYVGAPETVARKIAATMRELGAVRFDMKYSVGALSHDKLAGSIELYGSRVCSLVRDMLA
jgi:probable LLM family oxidoreductase